MSECMLCVKYDVSKLHEIFCTRVGLSKVSKLSI